MTSIVKRTVGLIVVALVISLNMAALASAQEPGTMGTPSMEKPAMPMVDLNHATMEELQTLMRVGPRTAQAIIDYRKVTPFEKIEDFMKVYRVGNKIFEMNKDRLTVTPMKKEESTQ